MHTSPCVMMERGLISALIFIFLTIALQVTSSPIPDHQSLPQQEYRLDAYRELDTQALILRIQPVNNRRHSRQDEDDDGPNFIPTVSPYVPAIIPGLTKIIQGIFTGSLTDIFHGSTSFAPQNISHAIDSVYNQVVGLAPPISTTRTPLVAETTVPSTRPPVPKTQSTRRAVVTRAPTRNQAQAQGQDKDTYYIPSLPLKIIPGQPLGTLETLGSSGSIIFTTQRVIRVSNEDDDDS